MGRPILGTTPVANKEARSVTQRVSKEPPVIHCPVCDSSGAVLRHDIRAALVYSCEICLHEWAIDSDQESPAAKPAFITP